jgi:hypothetical protein
MLMLMLLVVLVNEPASSEHDYEQEHA